MKSLETKQGRAEIKAILKKKYRTLEIAADKINLSKYTLSRLLNGGSCDLDAIIKTLKAAGKIPVGANRFPRIDLDTFCILNGLSNGKTKKKGVKK